MQAVEISPESTCRRKKHSIRHACKAGRHQSDAPKGLKTDSYPYTAATGIALADKAQRAARLRIAGKVRESAWALNSRLAELEEVDALSSQSERKIRSIRPHLVFVSSMRHQ